MANKKRRLGERELRDLQKIEKLLNNHEKDLKGDVQAVKEVKVEVTKPITKSIPFSDTKMSSHALDMAEERFGLKRRDATSYFRNKLRKAKFIGLQQAEDGNESCLYAIGREAMYLSQDLLTIISVNRYEKVTYEPLKEQVESLHRREINRLDRLEKSKKRKLELAKLEAAATISSLDLRAYKTRSKSVKLACAAHKKAIEIHIKELEDELNEIITNKRRACRSMVAIV